MLEHLSLPDTVRLTLRRQILNAELPAGTRLKEADLAAEYGVSRATVRQALRDLQIEGLVEISPRRYCSVTRMSAEDAEDVCFARYLLEAGAAARGPGGVPAEALLDLLKERLVAMEQAARDGDVAAIVEVDIEFHGLIVAGAGRRVQDLWHTLDGQMGALMRSALDRQHVDLSEAVGRHRQVLDALATGVPGTIEDAIRDHYVPALIAPTSRATRRRKSSRSA